LKHPLAPWNEATKGPLVPCTSGQTTAITNRRETTAVHGRPVPELATPTPNQLELGRRIKIIGNGERRASEMGGSRGPFTATKEQKKKERRG